MFWAALICIIEELLSVDYVLTNMKICVCTFRTSYSLPCACELGSYRLGIPIIIDVVGVYVDDGSKVDMSLWNRWIM